MSQLPDRELEGRPHSRLTTSCHARVRRAELVAALDQMRFWLKVHPSLRAYDDILVRIIGGTLELERAVPHKVGVQGLFRRTLPATHERPGAVAVPLAKLLRLCKSLETEFVDLGFSKPPSFYIQSASCRFLISCSGEETVPEAKLIETAGSMDLEGVRLKQLLRRLNSSLCRDDIRYGLNALHFEVFGSSIKLVTTDGHRLTLAWYGPPIEGKPIVFDMDAFGSMMLGHIAKTRDSWTLAWSDRVATWTAPGICLEVPLLEPDAFPNYPPIVPVPAQLPGRLTMKRRHLIAAVKRSLALTSRSTKPMAIQIQDGQAVLTTAPGRPVGKIGDYTGDTCEQNLNATFECLTEQPQVTRFGINPRYILDALRYSREEHVTLQFNQALSPLRIDEEDGAMTTILMPMRLD